MEKEQIFIIKKEYEELTNKLKELNEGELKEVIGGESFNFFSIEPISSELDKWSPLFK